MVKNDAISYGITVTCKVCNSSFAICRSCWRGQKYCSAECRRTGYQASRRKAQIKYQKTFKAKVLHSKRQQRYRQRVANKKVTHKSSNKSQVELNSSTVKERVCRKCEASLSALFNSFDQLKIYRSYYGKT